MRLWLLGSGSKGNAVLLESGDSRILVDAGFPARELATRLGALGVAPASIEACLITHEHTDHVRGAASGAKRWGWQLHATAGTTAGSPCLEDTPVETFASGATVRVGAFDVATVRTPHDATESVGVVATARASGARAGIVYDLGHATDAVRAALRDLDLLVLESNHDEGMLRAGPYPPSVTARIAGAHGHLSNVAAARLARECVSPTLKHVVLAHLSEKCNTPATALATVSAALGRTRFRGALDVALQHAPVGPFLPRPERAIPPSQLALAL